MSTAQLALLTSSFDVMPLGSDEIALIDINIGLLTIDLRMYMQLMLVTWENMDVLLVLLAVELDGRMDV